MKNNNFLLLSLSALSLIFVPDCFSMQNGQSVGTESDTSSTQLYHEIKGQDLSKIEKLLASVSDQEQKKALLETLERVVHIAAVEDDVETLRCLVRIGVNVNVKNKNRQTPLVLARLNSKGAATRYLNDSIIYQGRLFFAINEKNYAEAQMILTEQPELAGVRGMHADTPLHHAANNDDVDMLRLLVGVGGNIKVQDLWETLLYTEHP